MESRIPGIQCWGGSSEQLVKIKLSENGHRFNQKLSDIRSPFSSSKYKQELDTSELEFYNGFLLSLMTALILHLKCPHYHKISHIPARIGIDLPRPLDARDNPSSKSERCNKTILSRCRGTCTIKAESVRNLA